MAKFCWKVLRRESRALRTGFEAAKAGDLWRPWSRLGATKKVGKNEPNFKETLGSLVDFFLLCLESQLQKKQHWTWSFFFVNWFCNMWGNESIGLIGFPLVQIPGFFHHHRKVKLEFGARWRRFWAAENCIRLQGFIGVGVCFSWVNKIQQNGKALFRNRGKQNKSYYEVQSLSFFWLSSSFSVVVSWNCVFVDPRAMLKKIWCK